MMITAGYLLTYLYIFTIIGVIYLISKKLKFDSLITRKLIHIFVSFSFIIMYFYFKETKHIFILPFTILVTNYLFYLKNKKSPDLLGIVFYASSYFIMALVTYLNPIYYPLYAVSLFILAMGAGLAPIVALWIKSPMIYHNRSISGTAMVFISSVIVQYICYKLFGLDLSYLRILIISITSMLLELVSQKYDNLALPLGTFIFNIILGGF